LFFLRFTFFTFQSNPALRLKEELLTGSNSYTSLGTGPGGYTSQDNNEFFDLDSKKKISSDTVDTFEKEDMSGRGKLKFGIDMQYFNEKKYIEGKSVKKGDDPYAKNKFNQAASDKLASNREIPDTRLDNISFFFLTQLRVCLV